MFPLSPKDRVVDVSTFTVENSHGSQRSVEKTLGEIAAGNLWRSFQRRRPPPFFHRRRLKGWLGRALS